MSNFINKVRLGAKRHSPEILVITGVVGVVTSAVLACRATMKLKPVLDSSKDEIKDLVEKADEKDMWEEDIEKATQMIYVHTGIQIIKLYAPSVILGALSITSILVSNNILKKRSLALSAAYATIDSGFRQYRDRVVERFGEAVDKELKYNLKPQEIEETVTDEKGKEKTVKKTIAVAEDIDPRSPRSPYARFFDESCPDWEKDSEYNLMFLRNCEENANKKLQRRGYLFLNDVYQMLGMQETKAGQVVGWIYDEKNPTGDNYVDFGIYDIHRPKSREFVNGYERVILLDFNVDGDITHVLK